MAAAWCGVAGVDVPALEGNEQSFAELDVLLEKTMAFLDGLDSASFNGSESKEIVLRHNGLEIGKRDYMGAY